MEYYEDKFLSHDEKLDYSDVLMVPCQGDVASRSEVELEYPTGVIPIIAANMDGVGTFDMAKSLYKHNMLTALVKHYSLEELVTFFQREEASRNCFYSMGIGEADMTKLHEFMTHVTIGEINTPYGICVDVANGYTTQFTDALKRIIDTYPNMPIMAGNVVTPEQVSELSLIGVDIVKVGIGPGSVCTTRKLTGMGYPQFSAVLECADVHSICADGGITCPGDVAKAFGAGADFVMIGGLFAGHEEGLPAGYKDKTEFVSNIHFYGMASKAAQTLHNGGVAEYRASEGKEVTIKYKGPVENTVKEMLGGLRSACTYVGARNLMELSENARFVRVNRQLNNIFGNG